MKPVLKISRDYRHMVRTDSIDNWYLNSAASIQVNTTYSTDFPTGCLSIAKTGTGTSEATVTYDVGNVPWDVTGMKIEIDIFILNEAAKTNMASTAFQLFFFNVSGSNYKRVDIPKESIPVGAWYTYTTYVDSMSEVGTFNPELVDSIRFDINLSSNGATLAHGNVFLGAVRASYKNQVLDAYDVSFSDDLDGLGSGSFSIRKTSNNTLLIREMDKVELFGVRSSGTEALLFSGVILSISVKPTEFIYEIGDERIYLDKKILTAYKDWSTLTLEEILNFCTEAIQSRSFEAISYYTENPTVVAGNITHDAGTSIRTVLDDIAALLEYQWRVEKNIIYMDPSVGEDISANTTLTWNVDAPQENTIDDFQLRYDGNLIFTYVRGQNDTSSSTHTYNTSTYGYLEQFKLFPNGSSISDMVTKYVGETGKEQVNIQVEVSSLLDFSNINIGDTIRLEINGGHERQDISANIVIRQRNAVMTNNTIIWEVILKNENVSVRSVGGVFRSINDRLKKLEISS